MKSKEITYIFLAVIGIMMYNVFLIQRDQKLFSAYDRACAEISQKHSKCILAK